MLKPSVSQTTKVLLSTILALFSVSCSDRTSTVIPSPAPSSSDLVPISPTKSTQFEFSQPRYYELALDKADSAWSNSQSAHSSADWHLVAIQWQDAIALLQAVPENSPDRTSAQAKITEYQNQLVHAEQQAAHPTQNSDNVATVVPRLDSPRSNSTSDLNESSLSSQVVFQVPIKRLVGGTPVIEVTLNETEPVEMIVDTGATETVITEKTAAILGIVPVSKVKANTASATVEFPVGYVDSISVGGTTIKRLPVAIAPSGQLEIGLLGHNFFGNFDVTIKRYVVEFRPR